MLAPGESVTHLRTLAGYAFLLATAARRKGLGRIGWTLNAPRVGFCTWSFLQNPKPADIMTTTRHASVKTGRAYLDATTVLAGPIAQELKPRAAHAEYLMLHLLARLER